MNAALVEDTMPRVGLAVPVPSSLFLPPPPPLPTLLNPSDPYLVDGTRTSSMPPAADAKRNRRPEIGEASGSNSRVPIARRDWSNWTDGPTISSSAGLYTSPPTSSRSANRVDHVERDTFPVSDLRRDRTYSLIYGLCRCNREKRVAMAMARATRVL